MTKGQEALENLKTLDLDAMENESPNWGWYYNSKNESKAQMVRKDLVNIEKELKALQLLKEAYNMGIFSIEKYFISFVKREIEYVICDSEDWNRKKVTEEEYKLLKEVLENETPNNS